MNKDFTKFMLHVLRFVTLICSIFAVMLILGVFVIGCQYEDGYQASIIDKIARLKSINEPKIILVGNSNLSFGMSSPMIQEALNMPVVNLGLHGGLCNAFHESMAKQNINSGDIVIVCHANFANDDRIIDMNLAWITLEYHFDLWNILRPKDYTVFIQRYPIYWFKALFKAVRDYVYRKENSTKTKHVTAYMRQSFNECGDIALRPKYKTSPIETVYTSGSVNPPKIDDVSINRLNELNAFVKQKNAVMLVAGYPICFGEYTPPAEKYIAFQEELASKLDCEVISDYTDYFIPKKYFYDFILHLNDEGVRIRTQQLINDIRAWKSRHNNSPAN